MNTFGGAPPFSVATASRRKVNIRAVLLRQTGDELLAPPPAAAEPYERRDRWPRRRAPAWIEPIGRTAQPSGGQTSHGNPHWLRRLGQRAQLVERRADEARDVHLRAADVLRDLPLLHVLVVAHAQDVARAIVEPRGQALDRRARLGAREGGVL